MANRQSNTVLRHWKGPHAAFLASLALASLGPLVSADTFPSRAGANRDYGVAVDPGQHEFKVTSIAANKRTEWRLNGSTLQSDSSGSQKVDPVLRRTFTPGSNTVEAVVFKGTTKTIEETHRWRLTIRQPNRPPSSASIVTANPGTAGITLTVTAGSDPDGDKFVNEVRYRRRGTSAWSSERFEGTVKVIMWLEEDSAYELSVRRVESEPKNLASDWSPISTVKTNAKPNSPPTVVSGVKVSTTSDTASIGWSASTDPEGHTPIVYPWQLEATTGGIVAKGTNNTTEMKIPLTAEFKGTVVVYAQDRLGARNAGTRTPVVAAVKQNVAPTVPGPVQFEGVGTNYAGLKWSPGRDPDNGPKALVYEIAMVNAGSRTVLGTTSKPEWKATKLPAGALLAFEVRSFDGAAYSATASTGSVQLRRPPNSPPTHPEAEVSGIHTNNVRLRITAQPQDPDGDKTYVRAEVWIPGGKKAVSQTNGKVGAGTLTLTGLLPRTKYLIRLFGVDIGNRANATYRSLSVETLSVVTPPKNLNMTQQAPGMLGFSYQPGASDSGIPVYSSSFLVRTNGDEMPAGSLVNARGTNYFTIDGFQPGTDVRVRVYSHSGRLGFDRDENFSAPVELLVKTAGPPQGTVSVETIEDIHRVTATLTPTPGWTNAQPLLFSVGNRSIPDFVPGTADSVDVDTSTAEVGPHSFEAWARDCWGTLWKLACKPVELTVPDARPTLTLTSGSPRVLAPGEEVTLICSGTDHDELDTPAIKRAVLTVAGVPLELPGLLDEQPVFFNAPLTPGPFTVRLDGTDDEGTAAEPVVLEFEVAAAFVPDPNNPGVEPGIPEDPRNPDPNPPSEVPQGKVELTVQIEPPDAGWVVDAYENPVDEAGFRFWFLTGGRAYLYSIPASGYRFEALVDEAGQVVTYPEDEGLLMEQSRKLKARFVPE